MISRFSGFLLWQTTLPSLFPVFPNSSLGKQFLKQFLKQFPGIATVNIYYDFVNTGHFNARNVPRIMLPFFFFSQCCCCLVAKSSLIRQAPLSMGFLRQEYWSGLPFPSPMLPFFFFFMLPFLIHLFVSPEINKSHSNDSLDFPMHLPHTP